MNLKDKINQDLKDAMKSQDKVKLQTIRSIRALILEFEKSGKSDELTPDAELTMLNSAVKKRKEAAEQFRNAGRVELAQLEEAELEIILSYLPKQLSDEEIINEIKSIAIEINAVIKNDFPKLMPLVVKKLKGAADGKKIKELVEKYLGSN